MTGCAIPPPTVPPARPGPRGGWTPSGGKKHCLLTSFRRSSEPVPTPVWFGAADGRVYVRSEANAGKVKRIRRDPPVRVTPCNVRGKPTGPTTEGRARMLAAEEAGRAEAALSANYG